MKHPIATFAGSAASPLDFPRDRLPEVAFLGRSNVGKSSLLNALAGTRGLARVSSDPGRTRILNFYRVSGVPKPGGAGRGELYLVDLPGYGYAKAPREVTDRFEQLAVSYLVEREPLRLCVFIVDVRREPTADDETLRAWLLHHHLPFVMAANKLDTTSRAEGQRRLQALAGGDAAGSAVAVVGTSATRGTGIDELWKLISGAAFPPPTRPSVTPLTGDTASPNVRTTGNHAR